MTSEINTLSKNLGSFHHVPQEAPRPSGSPLPFGPENSTYNSQFDPPGAYICDNPKLRMPQVEGFQAACAHFSDANVPAIIQLPVGCGKSGPPQTAARG